MERKLTNTAILAYLEEQYGQNGTDSGFSLPELMSELEAAGLPVAERTLRRWIGGWCDAGLLERTGQKRGTRYYLADAWNRHNHRKPSRPHFLASIEPAKRTAILAQLRDLWTHHSTALEGNTLSIGDTYSVLELGLTVSGKPLREHHEVVGHASAIELLYNMLVRPIKREDLFDLHRAVQKEIVVDIYNPVGAWKVENNYASSVTSDGEQVVIEYAAPGDVERLMAVWLDALNERSTTGLTITEAAVVYAQLYMAFASIHPFADGNGRVARLASNIPLLKAGLPPLVINRNRRREYIELLADYQSASGAPMLKAIEARGLWPESDRLKPFIAFCEDNYSLTRELVDGG